jgi:hypothetical protein
MNQTYLKPPQQTLPNNELLPWIRVLCERLVTAEAVKEFPAFYET